MLTAGYGGLTHFIMENVDFILAKEGCWAGGILAGSIMGSRVGVWTNVWVGTPPIRHCLSWVI
jgi:uncharacterized membrane protein YfcA